MITIPKITNPTSGLVYSRYSWKAEVTENGKRRQYSLGVKDRTDTAAAIAARDKLYRALRAAGALDARTPEAAEIRRRSINPADPKKFIHHIGLRKPYKVVINHRLVGLFATLSEAMDARNAELGLIGGAA